jgi:type II secretory pathway pseudopilin PulG
MKEEVKALDRATIDSEMENIEKMITQIRDDEATAAATAAENDARADEEVKRLMAISSQAQADERAAREAEKLANIAAQAARDAAPDTSSDDDNDSDRDSNDNNNNNNQNDDDDADDDATSDNDTPAPVHHAHVKAKAKAKSVAPPVVAAVPKAKTANKVMKVAAGDEERDVDLVSELRAAMDLWGVPAGDVAVQSGFPGGEDALIAYIDNDGRRAYVRVRDKQDRVRQWLQKQYAQPGNSAPPDTVAWGRDKSLPLYVHALCSSC